MKYRVSACLMLTMLHAPVWAEEESADPSIPNFEVALGSGLLDSKPLFNIDFLVNIPLNQTFSTQVLLNSNYQITGSSEDSFAQSEFASNWFASNKIGRLGVGLGISEFQPKDDNQESERSAVGRVMADAFFDKLTLTGNYTTYDRTLSNTTATKVGLDYYLTDDKRLSFYRERFNGDGGWRGELFWSPEKYERKGSFGIIARQANLGDYLGFIARYYFDSRMSLIERERRYH